MTKELLKKHEDIVKPILERFPETRSDDFLLYAEVIREFRPELANVPVMEFLTGHRNLLCPSYESITRVRRRLQAKFPELVSERTKEKRLKQEAEYRAYAREA